MILPKTVMSNMKKGLRRMSTTQLNELLESEKRAITILESNNKDSKSRTFSHRQKIQLIQDELKIRENSSIQTL